MAEAAQNPAGKKNVVEYSSGEKRAPSAIVGHSKGGDAVLLYAFTYHDICTVVNVSGRYDLKKGIEQRLGKDLTEAIKKEGFIDVMNKPGDGNYRVTEESLMDRLSVLICTKHAFRLQQRLTLELHFQHSYE